MSIVDLDKQTLAGKRFGVEKLASLIEEGYLKTGREPKDTAKVSFAPSSLGYGSGTCPRQWFYAFTGGVMREDSADAAGIANMSYGTDAHSRLQYIFEQTGILVETEKQVYTVDKPELGFPPINGYVDLVINWQGEECVGEIKTTTQESYVSKKAKGTGAGYHILQVLIYMKVLGLNKGFLLYENKNNQRLLIVPIVWNPVNRKLADDAFAWMQLVYDNWKGGDETVTTGLPKRPFYSEKSLPCKGCPFKTHCWEDEEGVVDLPALEVPK